MPRNPVAGVAGFHRSGVIKEEPYGIAKEVIGFGSI